MHTTPHVWRPRANNAVHNIINNAGFIIVLVIIVVARDLVSGTRSCSGPLVCPERYSWTKKMEMKTV
jgi:hypothetical protein